MRYENEGRFLWFGTTDAPTPEGDTSITDRVSITVGVQPADTSNRIEVRYRVNNGPIQTASAAWIYTDPGAKAQYFRAEIGGLRPGDSVRYGAVCHCAGRQVPGGSESDRLDGSFRIAEPSGFVDLSPSAPRSGIERPLPSAPLPQPTERPVSPAIDLPRPPVREPNTAIETPSQPAASPHPPEPEVPNITLADIGRTLRVERAPELLHALERRGLRTLADVRAAGGIKHLADLPVAPDHPAVKALEAHAQLAVISSDPEINAKLIERGFGSIGILAKAPRLEFIRNVQGAIDETQAERIYQSASAVQVFLNNAYVDMITTGANRPVGIKPLDTVTTISAISEPATLSVPTDLVVDEAEPEQCRCRDCESASSPLAYLAVLLKYALINLKNAGNPIDLDFLVKTFYQPFPDLTGLCGELDNQQLQVRLCIEVLRRYWNANYEVQNLKEKQPSLDQAEADYCRRAYFTLLNRIGTNYEELRLARAGTEKEQQALAEKLGIHVNLVKHNALLLVPTDEASAFLKTSMGGIPGFPPPWSPELTERSLEYLFGLPSTTPPSFTPQNRLTISFDRPLLKVWRQEYLRLLWQKQDWPIDAYDDRYEPSDQRLPIIDPDLIGPDDFRNPNMLGTWKPIRAFDLWLKRRAWVDKCIDYLNKQQKIVGGQHQYDFAAMLGLMYEPIFGYGMTSTESAWSSNTPLDDFETLREALTEGDQQDINSTRTRLTSDLKLTVEAFNRLMSLRDKEESAESDPRQPGLSPAEWSEVISILTASWKQGWFARWREEEKATGIMLSPQEFWFSLRRPIIGDWPPASSPDRPLLDPEILTLTDLIEPIAGWRASDLWRNRQRQLAESEREFKVIRRTSGLDGVLRHAFGDPLPLDLDELVCALDHPERNISGSPAAEAAAKAESDIVDRLHLSVAAFRYLMDIRARENGDPRQRPRREEWAEIIATLVTAWKEIQAYPAWKAEEQADNLAYWSTLKAKLPPWRASIAGRQAWLEALRARSAPPLIDPDLLIGDDFKHPLASDPAFGLWLERQRWAESIVKATVKHPGNTAPLPGRPPFLDTSSPPTQALQTFDALMREVCDIELAELGELANHPVLGFELEARLVQLNLTYEECDFLLRIRRLTAIDAPIMTEEYDQAASIRCQIVKRRKFAEWQAEERQAGLILNPDVFQIPEKDSNEFVPLRWRNSWIARHDWQDNLRARIDQDNAVVQSLAEAVRAAEIEALPALRDALVEATAPISGDLTLKAQWITDNLLIDANLSGCHRTTRVAQAIETIQLLLWTVHNQWPRNTFCLGLADQADFARTWSWLSNYESWRYVLLRYLYPENLLHPVFRNTQYQSPGFERLRQDLEIKTITESVNQFKRYYDDTRKLTVACYCRRMISGNGLNFLYATSEDFQHYWNVLSFHDEDHYPPTQLLQSFWYPLQSFDKNTAIIGAVPFRSSDDREESILVFGYLGRSEKQEIVAARQKLTGFRWDRPNDLQWEHLPGPWPIPFGIQTFSIVVVQQTTVDQPIVVIKDDNSGALFEARVSRSGNGWASGYPKQLATIPTGWMLKAGISAQNDKTSPYYLFTQAGDDNDIHCYVVDKGLSKFEKLGTGDFFGAFYFSGPPYTVNAVFGRLEFIQVKRLSFEEQWKPVFGVSDGVGGKYAKNFAVWLKKKVGVNIEEILLTSKLRKQLVARNHDVSNPDATITLDEWLNQEDWEGLEKVFDFLFVKPPINKGAQTGLLTNPNHVDQWFDFADKIIDEIQYESWTSRDDEIVKDNTNSSQTIRDALRNLIRIEYPIRKYYNNNFLRISLEINPILHAQYNFSMYDISLGDVNDVSFINWTSPILALARQSGEFFDHDDENGLYALLVTRHYEIDNEYKYINRWAIGRSHLVGSRNQINFQKLAYINLFDEIQDVSTNYRNPLSEFFTFDTQYLINLIDQNSDCSYSVKNTIYEYYYFVPILVALTLQKRGNFSDALSWFRLVYDYTLPVKQQEAWYDSVLNKSCREGISFYQLLFVDPNDPHRIAETRCNTYTRYTVLSIVHCLLDYADAEFAKDTDISLAQADMLYAMALELLKSEDLIPSIKTPCENIIDTLDNPIAGAVFDPPSKSLWKSIRSEIQKINDVAVLQSTVREVNAILKGGGSLAERLAKARDLARKAALGKSPLTLGAVLSRDASSTDKTFFRLIANPEVAAVASRIARFAAMNNLGTKSPTNLPEAFTETRSFSSSVGKNQDPINKTGPFSEQSSENGLKSIFDPITHWLTEFCVPSNPVIEALRQRAIINQNKRNNCLNFAGMPRSVDTYAVSFESGLPGGAILPRPSIYRSAWLIERSKQWIEQASRLEAAMLSALQQKENEGYQLLLASQATELAQAKVTLQELQIQQARGSVTIASRQRQRAQAELDHFSNLLSAGLSTWETANLISLSINTSATLGKGITDIANSKAENVLSTIFGAISSTASSSGALFNQLAIYERRKEDWLHARTLAQHDVGLAEQQQLNAKGQVLIAQEERNMSQLSAQHSRDALNFLRNKFLNADLYEWLSEQLEALYRFFLQQATAIARLAAGQLAFERLEILPIQIQTDYWRASPSQSIFSGEIDSDTVQQSPDRRGLTGSARLLRDVYQLEQYAQDTEKRKLQLSKTISLSQEDPFAFQKFRETGILLFNSPLALFDRDFPGHYLRLIKRVRTSVVALVPPYQGIHATLSSTGVSRVVVGPDVFQTIILRRDSESVALTSPRDATGLFELQPQPELLLPFEGLGVDMFWELRMPKASNSFDYDTLADVLFTIDYTALDSYVYRQQVIDQLDDRFSADCLFSFRWNFADQWYDLHNSEQTTTPMTVRFQTRRVDFPPNIEDLRIQQAVLYFVRAANTVFEIPVQYLRFRDHESGGAVGGAAMSSEGVISTRRGNAPAWMAMIGHAPIGEWELSLPHTPQIVRRFQNEEITDILFVLTYAGRTPPWPR